MAEFKARTATEQLADYLQGELARKRWSGFMPGSSGLARELGVGNGTMEAALVLLEQKGILVPQGKCRRRRIEPRVHRSTRSRRIQLLLYEDSDRKLGFMADLLRRLQLAGYSADFSHRTLTEMKMNVRRVARYVVDAQADIWIVVGGSREILEWFAGRSEPAYALFGRSSSVDIPAGGTLKTPAFGQMVERLKDLGHRRIVMLTRSDRRKPEPGLVERRFLEILSAHGLPSGDFNLPDWEDTPAGFRECLDALFAVTPPTALNLSQPHLYFAAQQHLASRGIIAPRDVSMICSDFDPVFAWATPSVAHLRWDSQALVSKVMRWVNHVERGQDNRRQSLINADFVEGGTVGPVPRG